ncbi:MAG TPA: undecaprenyl-diphosphate phosphatase [Lachnospiraceae bacterium]|nr:undecaprenyl-diphosphate phosphatase [Lachnospiraceae bacterium]
MDVIDIVKVILFGVVEGITEWLPISSTGHMILLNEFVTLNVSKEFFNIFLVVIQLGAILAVIVIFWKKIFPFQFKEKNKPVIEKDILTMWFKIIVACIPAAIVGVGFDDELDALFYNYQTVSISLIVFGIAFIIIEERNKGTLPRINSLSDITYKTAAIIGLFQLISAIFPGTSRSGATILGALLIGVSRTIAAEFTFFLAIPVMFGASLLKIVKGGLNFTQTEFLMLVLAMLVAFIVSMLVIKLLMNYIKKHDFKVFGWYRIILGIIVLGYFAFL